MIIEMLFVLLRSDLKDLFQSNKTLMLQRQALVCMRSEHTA